MNEPNGAEMTLQSFGLLLVQKGATMMQWMEGSQFYARVSLSLVNNKVLVGEGYVDLMKQVVSVLWEAPDART